MSGRLDVLQATYDSETIRDLAAIEQKLASAWANRDCAGWSALLADDWSVTHIDAQVVTKAQALDMCRAGPPVTTAVDELSIRVYGDTAIVTGRTEATVSGPQPETVTLRFTDVLIRRDGRWFVVASHATRLG
jgi:ketosteroid isomerase-like protein